MIFFWTIYPIAWGLCEGSNIISVTGEMIFYGILDIFTKPVFAILTLFLRRNMDINKKKSEVEIPYRTNENLVSSRTKKTNSIY